MSDELLIRHCSPTLAGLKTGNLFTCASSSREKAVAGVRRLNQMLGEKGLRVLLLQYVRGRALVYVFRPNALEKDLSDSERARILKRVGYQSTKPWHCLAELVRRLEKTQEFPHEIGLFLSYPPEDVEGFMRDRPDCKCVGCWKVYGDEQKARRLFETYRQCADAYRRQWTGGRPLAELVVTI